MQFRCKNHFLMRNTAIYEHKVDLHFLRSDFSYNWPFKKNLLWCTRSHFCVCSWHGVVLTSFEPLSRIMPIANPKIAITNMTPTNKFAIFSINKKRKVQRSSNTIAITNWFTGWYKISKMQASVCLKFTFLFCYTYCYEYLVGRIE